MSCSGDSISRLACNRHPIQAPSPGHDKGDLANAPPPPNDRHKILSSRITVWHALCAEISRAINLSSSSSSSPLLSFFPISWISCEHLRAHGRCTAPACVEQGRPLPAVCAHRARIADVSPSEEAATRRRPRRHVRGRSGSARPQIFPDFFTRSGIAHQLSRSSGK